MTDVLLKAVPLVLLLFLWWLDRRGRTRAEEALKDARATETVATETARSAREHAHSLELERAKAIVEAFEGAKAEVKAGPTKTPQEIADALSKTLAKIRAGR